MKRYLWVVERKDGDEWVPRYLVGKTRREARESMFMLIEYRKAKYRVVKYTPAE